MIGAIGYVCVDVFPELGDTPFEFKAGSLLEVGAMPITAGGVVGNTGGALARLGIPVRLGGVAGNDLLAPIVDTCIRRVVGEKTDFRLITVSGQSTAYSIVLAPQNHDRMFLVNRGANDAMTADTFGPDFRAGLSMLHYGYPTLSIGMAKDNGAETRKLFERCHADGIFTSLDMALPSPGTFSWDLDWRAFLANVLPVTDLFCPSIDELRFMLKAETASADDMAKELIAMGAHGVLLKMGSEGLMVRVADTDSAEKAFARFGSTGWRGFYAFVTPEPVTVYGTTGAGDSAIAGFLAGVHEGLSPEICARLASKTAASRIGSPDGIQGIPPLRTLI